MKWQLIEPNVGDIVRVKQGAIYHYGIFNNENEIVQFGLNPALKQNQKDTDVEVCLSNVDNFLCGDFIEVGVVEKKDGKPVRKAKAVVEYAKSRLGEKGYNILYNNCEHFAYDCVFGKKRCSQADEARKFIKSLPLTKVFTAIMPEKQDGFILNHSARQKEIDGCASVKVKREKYYAWKLLEYGLYNAFGKTVDQLDLVKNKEGKWQSDFCYISLSHSGDMVAVAISRTPVGVDVEELVEPKTGAIERVLTKKEKKEFESVSQSEKTEFLITKWTEKESAFKKGKDKKFIPSKIDTEKFSFKTKIIQGDGKEYVLTTCVSSFDNFSTQENIKL